MYKTGDLVVVEGYTNIFSSLINIGQKLFGRTKNHKVFHVGMIYHSGYYLHALYGKGVIFSKINENVSVWRLKTPLSPKEVREFKAFKEEYLGTRYETNIWEFLSSLLDWTGSQEADTERFFCSELVAEFFIRSGRLGADLPSNEYTPQNIVNSGLWERPSNDS